MNTAAQHAAELSACSHSIAYVSQHIAYLDIDRATTPINQNKDYWNPRRWTDTQLYIIQKKPNPKTNTHTSYWSMHLIIRWLANQLKKRWRRRTTADLNNNKELLSIKIEKSGFVLALLISVFTLICLWCGERGEWMNGFPHSPFFLCEFSIILHGAIVPISFTLL
jgi:hypothetical protein